MELVIRILVAKYGADVLEWSVKKILSVFIADGGDISMLAESDDCQRARNAEPIGLRLDPDCGVFFWELPYKEQM